MFRSSKSVKDSRQFVQPKDHIPSAQPSCPPSSHHSFSGAMESSKEHHQFCQSDGVQDKYFFHNECNVESDLSSLYSCGQECSVLECPSGCDPPCDELVTCEGSVCLNPSDCSSVECCREPQCFDHSRRPSVDFDAVALDTQDASSFFGPGIDDPMHCRWLLPNQQCDVSAPSVNELSQHVVHDHIEPQTLLTCEWDHCADVVDAKQLTDHLRQNHHPDTYVCLWQGCGQTFSDGEQLENHMEVMHSNLNLDCHWGGCEVATKGPSELKSHIHKEHLNVPERAVYPLDFPSHHQLCASQAQCSNSLPSMYYNDQRFYHDAKAEEATSSYPLHSTGDYINISCTCKWITDRSLGTSCEASFKSENELQTHVDRAHIDPISARGAPEKYAFVCEWPECKRNRFPHQNKDKLRRHVYIHTGCESTFATPKDTVCSLTSQSPRRNLQVLW